MQALKITYWLLAFVLTITIPTSADIVGSAAPDRIPHRPDMVTTRGYVHADTNICNFGGKKKNFLYL